MHKHQSRLTTIIRIAKVEEITGLSQSTIYRLIKKGRFPAHLQLGERVVGWRLNDIQEWLDTLPVGNSAGELNK